MKNLLIRKIYYKILWLLPKEKATKIRYRIATHQKLNMKDPEDFNQKILYLLVNRYGKLETKCADKYQMRNYVKQKGLEKYLPILYHIYKDVNEIDFKELPDEYVLKPNNGCGGIYIHQKGKDINEKEVLKKLNKALHTNYAKDTLEYQYNKIPPLIICEQYLKEGDLKNPIDYKFYCFKGKVDCVLVCSEREKKLKRNYYDTNWNKLEYMKNEEDESSVKFQKPSNFKEMLSIASKLSEDFPFVRVDLYNINGKIYIGELTFTPAGGIMKSISQEALNHLGSLIEI